MSDCEVETFATTFQWSFSLLLTLQRPARVDIYICGISLNEMHAIFNKTYWKCYKPILLTSRLLEERNRENESREVSSESQKQQLKT